jgi:hypothetical protein
MPDCAAYSQPDMLIQGRILSHNLGIKLLSLLAALSTNQFNCLRTITLILYMHPNHMPIS